MNDLSRPPIDFDAEETAEWKDSLQSLLHTGGPQRVRQIMDMLSAMARDPAIGWTPKHGTPYVNTIAPSQQPSFPGDLAIEERLQASLLLGDTRNVSGNVQSKCSGKRFEVRCAAPV